MESFGIYYIKQTEDGFAVGHDGACEILGSGNTKEDALKNTVLELDRHLAILHKQMWDIKEAENAKKQPKSSPSAKTGLNCDPDGCTCETQEYLSISLNDSGGYIIPRTAPEASLPEMENLDLGDVLKIELESHKTCYVDNLPEFDGW